MSADTGEILRKSLDMYCNLSKKTVKNRLSPLHLRVKGGFSVYSEITVDLSCVDTEILLHQLGDVRYADEIHLDNLASAGVVGDCALWEAQRVVCFNDVILLVEANFAES